ncbi:cupin domain-containing protein [Klenkia sp. PcliD-1-E]|uniref:cupin domain-containing protein n=1 Tax=Klenkia sp. PcliD-1-E TaxID=2954492 RepID=UPI002096FA30|nr:cupin domain-containing protein [Klenkia sp. PcliD-1-E]MCO7219897.1 cupin domain-containing protein [Klenkia sp. PcliD-1-E]
MTARPATAQRLDLAPHPEGGWFRRTWTGPPGGGGRPQATAILFLLAPGESSARHTVDADELWLWHGPGALELHVGEERVVLDAAHPQTLVPAGVPQATAPAADEVLVSCVVSPGFRWSGFALS